MEGSLPSSAISSMTMVSPAICPLASPALSSPELLGHSRDCCSKGLLMVVKAPSSCCRSQTGPAPPSPPCPHPSTDCLVISLAPQSLTLSASAHLHKDALCALNYDRSLPTKRSSKESPVHPPCPRPSSTLQPHLPFQSDLSDHFLAPP